MSRSTNGGVVVCAMAMAWAVGWPASAGTSTLVTAKDDAMANTQALQHAVDTYDEVQLEGDFVLVNPILIRRDGVTITAMAGVDGEKGARIATAGFPQAFLVTDVKGVQTGLSISGLQFDDAGVFALLGGRAENLHIVDNAFRSVSSFAGVVLATDRTQGRMSHVTVADNTFTRARAIVNGWAGSIEDVEVVDNLFVGALGDAMYFQGANDARIAGNEVYENLGGGLTLCCSTDLVVEGNVLSRVRPIPGRWFGLLLARTFEDTLVVDNTLCGAGLSFALLGGQYVNVASNDYRAAWDADIGISAYSNQASHPASCNNSFQPHSRQLFVQPLDDDVFGNTIDPQFCAEGEENEFAGTIGDAVGDGSDFYIAPNKLLSAGLADPPTEDELKDLWSLCPGPPE